MSHRSEKLWTNEAIGWLLFVLVVSFFTYFWNYAYPASVFWDENYHIASAQKYLHGVHFMEPHPPLGKLLIALGEKIFHPNAVTNQFVGTDYGTNFGSGFSFGGYRFFSALLGWWTAPILFCIFLLLTRRARWSGLLSFLYVFDNALIVHMRGAMLEGALMFFSATTLLSFLLILRYRDHFNESQTARRKFMLSTIAFGVSFACALGTKAFALIFILLVPIVLYKILVQHWSLIIGHWRLALKFLGLCIVSFTIPYVAIWHTHFALGSTINSSLPDIGYYQASASYKKILRAHTNGSLLNFPIMIRDSWKFLSHYSKGAPKLDLCKTDENGSPFYFWPLGGRSINYRWETPDGYSYRYLYLQSNPVVWWASFAAVLVGAALLLCSVIAPPKNPLPHRFELTVFLGLYFAYMLAISRITRVMYLYHYFIPLFFSFIVLALVLMNLERIGKFSLTEERKSIGLLVLAALIFVSFQFYRPLTYYLPITDEQFQERSIFGPWELHCVKCPKISGLVSPR